jgi:ABC-type multidrug transport system fused ATPase/permease subunit
VGIVGRTGSGKSSLILTILRIVELDCNLKDPNCESYIEIDGRKLHELGIKTARDSVTLIPQDPFLISGTVRSNVDPFNKFTDDQVIQVLKETSVLTILKSTIERG